MDEPTSENKAPSITIRAAGDAVWLVIDEHSPVGVAPGNVRVLADALVLAAAMVEKRVRPPEAAGQCALCGTGTPYRICGGCLQTGLEEMPSRAELGKKARRKK